MKIYLFVISICLCLAGASAETISAVPNQSPIRASTNTNRCASAGQYLSPYIDAKILLNPDYREELSLFLPQTETGQITIAYQSYISVINRSMRISTIDGDIHPATPQLVAYGIYRNRENKQIAGYKRPRWYREPVLSFLWPRQQQSNRGLDDSYRGAGRQYHRGHLAAKFLLDRINPKAGCNSFHFTNAIPQNPELNSGSWYALERLSEAWANHYEKVWVLTGPIYDQDTPAATIGDPDEVKVAIPNEIYKIIIKESDIKTPHHSFDILAFIYPNKTSPEHNFRKGCSQSPMQHQAFLSSVSMIEKKTVLFFKFLSDQQKNQQPQKLWPVAAKDFDDSCGRGDIARR